MADQQYIKIHTNSFQGGTTISKKLGVANSFYQSINLDNRSDPAQLSVLPGARTLSSTLSDTITAITQDLNGVRWGIGTLGNLYQIDTSNNITLKQTLTENGSTGLLYNQVTDQLYIPGQTSVSMYGQVTSGIVGNPVFRSNQFAQSASTANGCVNLYNTVDGFFDGAARNNSQNIGVGITEAIVTAGTVTTNSTTTYTTPTTLSEGTGNYCYFAPDIEPFYSIMVYVKAKGTGNWTLTLHDSLNNTLATVTKSNASLTSATYNEFVFSGPIRALVNASQTGTSATYHFHITSTVADGTVGTLTASDLSSADFLLFAYRLVTTKNGWHPTALFTGSGVPLLCIGNGNYLSTYNFGNDSNPMNSQWQRHNLTFKAGYEVCGLTTLNQYLVIAVERRSSNSSRNAQDGALYLWDGTTNAPSIFVDVPMGSPYSIYAFNNVVYFACAGSLFAYAPGGSSVIKVRKLAYQNTDYLGAVDSTIINPNMFTARYNLLMMGYPSTTTNANLNYGVYSWGTVELTFPNSYMLSYTLAKGYLNNNTSGITNLQIGCVKNFVDAMYISWSYTLAGVTYYGLDVVDNFSNAASTFSWQSLYYDGGVSYKIKQAARIKLSMTALPTGSTVQLGYSLDRGAWTYPATATVGDVGLTCDINQRFHEIQYGFKGTTTNINTPPTFIGVTLEIQPLESEDNMTKNQ